MNFKLVILTVVLLTMIGSKFSIGENAFHHNDSLKCDTIILPLINIETQVVCKSYDEGFVSIELITNGLISKRLEIYNANFTEEYCQIVLLDTIGEPEYLITAYNMSSTFGMVYPVIVWLNGGWWDLMSLPFQKFKLIDKNSDGIYEIEEPSPNQRKLEFRDGIFTVIE